MNLTGASAISAKFNSTQMEYVVWKNGDFSGAQFINTNIMRSRFNNSVFNKSIHDRTLLHLSDFTNTQMFGVEFHRSRFDGIFLNRLITDDMTLRKLILEEQFEVKDLDNAYLLGPISQERLIAFKLMSEYCNEERTNRFSFLTCEYSTSGQMSKVVPRQESLKKSIFQRLTSQFSECESIDSINIETDGFAVQRQPRSEAIMARNLRFLGS